MPVAVKDAAAAPVVTFFPGCRSSIKILARRGRLPSGAAAAAAASSSTALASAAAALSASSSSRSWS